MWTVMFCILEILEYMYCVVLLKISYFEAVNTKRNQTAAKYTAKQNRTATYEPD
jgi:hypothetical protein